MKDLFRILSAFLFGALIAVFARTSYAETLQEAVTQAIRTNPEALEAINRRLAADEGVRVARGGYLPRVDLNGGIGRERLDDSYARSAGMSDTTFTRRLGAITVTQMLFDGFSVKSAVATQKARVASSASRVALTAEDLALRAVAAYLEVMRRQETVLAAKESFNAHQHIYQQIKRRSESGVGRGADLVQAQARLALATDNLRTEQSSLTEAEIHYVRLVGTQPSKLIKPTLPSHALPIGEAIAVDTALKDHPSIKAAEADVAAARAQQSAAKAPFYPTLELELGAAHDNDRLRGLADDRSIMLRVRYNLFQGGSDRARVNEVGFQVRELTETLNRIRRQVIEDTGIALNAMLANRDKLVALAEYAASSAGTRDAYLKQFNIGQRSLLDLLNSEIEYYNARYAYITGQYAEMGSAYQLLAAIGHLLNSLDVSPPPQAMIATQ